MSLHWLHVLEQYFSGCAPKICRSWTFRIQKRVHRRKSWWTYSRATQHTLVSMKCCAGCDVCQCCCSVWFSWKNALIWFLNMIHWEHFLWLFSCLIACCWAVLTLHLFCQIACRVWRQQWRVHLSTECEHLMLVWRFVLLVMLACTARHWLGMQRVLSTSLEWSLLIIRPNILGTLCWWMEDGSWSTVTGQQDVSLVRK